MEKKDGAAAQAANESTPVTRLRVQADRAAADQLTGSEKLSSPVSPTVANVETFRDNHQEH
jgi:hypothetical protein